MNGYGNIPNPDPYEPQFKFYDVNKPFKTESSGMDPATGYIIASGLTGLSNYFSGRGERREREREREFRERQFRAEQARKAAIAEQVRPLFENLKGLDFSSIGGQSFGQPMSEQERLRRIFGGM